MRWSLKKWHFEEWWKSFAFRPRYCASCENLIWLEWVYKNRRQVICPACLTLVKLQNEQGKRDEMEEMLRTLKQMGPGYLGGPGRGSSGSASKISQWGPPPAMGGLYVRQTAPDNSRIAANTVSAALQQSGSQAATNGLVPVPDKEASARIGKVRKAAQ